MGPKQALPILSRLLLIVVLSLIPAHSAAAQGNFKVLHSFGGGSDGAGLWSAVVLDKQGNLYGTTSGGGGTGCGGSGCGSVFELTSGGGGRWTEQVLYSFQGGSDGEGAFGGVILDSAGNLYGTTTLGGTHGFGTAFELAPDSGGWTLAVLYSFGAYSGDAGPPHSGFTMDGAGNLYGSAAGGSIGAGAVFELARDGSGWTESLLYSFGADGGIGGSSPYSGLVLDASGNLYGATEEGGTFADGVVCEVTHAPQDWKEHVLHSFGSFANDGKKGQLGQLALDSRGNLYGTTNQGGGNLCVDVGCGTVFKLTRGANGHWKETILYNFQSGPTGSGPGAGVVVDEAGNLYGTTVYGGSTNCGCGVVYKLAPGSGGTWTYDVLHTFVGSDGAQPDANLVLDAKGNLYGTTATGGTGGGGVVFEVTP